MFDFTEKISHDVMAENLITLTKPGPNGRKWLSLDDSDDEGTSKRQGPEVWCKLCRCKLSRRSQPGRTVYLPTVNGNYHTTLYCPFKSQGIVPLKAMPLSKWRRELR